MRENKQYSLDEAIRTFYKTEPLKIDLAKNVASKIYVKPKKVSVKLDNWLYVFVVVLAVGGLIFSFSLFTNYSLPTVFLVLIPVACFFGLSAKEYLLMSKRFLSAE